MQKQFPTTTRSQNHSLNSNFDNEFALNQSSEMLEEWSNNILQHDPMRIYRAKRDAARRTVASKYTIIGFISSGTYGRVYKAQSLDEDGKIHAIKKFKPDKEGDVITYTGISQSAIREIAVRMLLIRSVGTR